MLQGSRRLSIIDKRYTYNIYNLGDANMTSINRKANQNVQSDQAAKDGYGAVISTTFATVAMTAFLWSQIVAGLVQPIA